MLKDALTDHDEYEEFMERFFQGGREQFVAHIFNPEFFPGADPIRWHHFWSASLLTRNPHALGTHKLSAAQVITFVAMKDGRFGFSWCSEVEPNWSRRIGREQAIERANEHVETEPVEDEVDEAFVARSRELHVIGEKVLGDMSLREPSDRFNTEAQAAFTEHRQKERQVEENRQIEHELADRDQPVMTAIFR